MNRLKDKVAIVTGGAVGIGRATAELFAEEGAKVVVADRLKPEFEALFVETDISNEDDCRKVCDEAVRAFGRLDILVNNAATFVLKGLEATVDDWQRSLNVNIVGTALMSKYASEHMKRSGGAIVNLGSISSFIAQPSFITYSATRAAIVQMT